MPVSQTSAKSAFSSAALSRTKAGRLTEPDSSSPSTMMVTPIGRSPVSAIVARSASTKVMTWPLSSQAPRATMTRAAGLDLPDHRLEGLRSPQRLQRIDRLDVIMAVEQHMRCAGLRAMGEHDRMAGRLTPEPAVEAERLQILRQPFRGAAAVGRHRLNRSRSRGFRARRTGAPARLRDRRRGGRGWQAALSWNARFRRRAGGERKPRPGIGPSAIARRQVKAWPMCDRGIRGQAAHRREDRLSVCRSSNPARRAGSHCRSGARLRRPPSARRR